MFFVRKTSNFSQFLSTIEIFNKYKLFDLTLFISVLSTFRLIQQSLSYTRFWELTVSWQYGSSFFIMRLILVRTWRDNLPKYGRAIANSYLVTARTTVFGTSVLSKTSFVHLSTKSAGSCFYKKYFSITGISDFSDYLQNYVFTFWHCLLKY